MTYRPEVDGLRAVAVVAVILSHANAAWMPGGFLGVDIFFVISGYLITGILLGDLAQGRFSLARFYERRIRRILPALFLVVVCTMPMIMAVTVPGELEAYLNSVVATVLFLSNVYFWFESGYFATDAGELPLIHTWSLAVEEQFYILFPLALAALWRFGVERLIVGFAVIALLSLAAAHWAEGIDGDLAFYMLPFRAWELLAGGLVALAHRRYGRHPNTLRAAAGAVLIALPLGLFSGAMPNYFLSMAAPVAGAALILAYAEPARGVGRILALRPVVGVGLISYSAYLWHQPLFAWARLRDVVPPDPWFMAALTVAILPLSWASWRFVEQPCRRGAAPRRLVFGAAAASLLVTAIAGGVASGRSDALSPYPREPEYDWIAQSRQHDCLLQTVAETEFAPECYAKAAPRILLWGDSHAGALSPALGSLAARHGFGLTQLNQNGCPPLLGLDPGILVHRSNCNEGNGAVLSHLAETDYDLVVLHAAWSHWGYPMDRAAFAAAVDRTARDLARDYPGLPILVLGPVPRWFPSAYKTLVFTERHRPGDLVRQNGGTFAPAYFAPSHAAALARGFNGAGFHYLDPTDALCLPSEGARGPCLVSVDGSAAGVTAIDAAHLSRAGAAVLAERLIEPYLIRLAAQR